MDLWVSRMPRWWPALLGAVLLWLAQPPLKLGWIAWVAMIPWIAFSQRQHLCRRDHLSFYLVACLFYGLTMQGIRHAHPAMYATLVLFAVYLGMYAWLFVVLVRAATFQPHPLLPIWLTVPCIGTGLECIRNYLLTGISAVMLGHTQADYPVIIQIADAFGSYGVTFIVLMANAAIYQTWHAHRRSEKYGWQGLAATACILLATLGYGVWRLDQNAEIAESRRCETTIALIGRDEEIVFVQDADRELQIFDAYARTSLEAAAGAAKDGWAIDAYVWPESMYTGGLPWLLLESPNGRSKPMESASLPIVEENRKQFQFRSGQLQQALQAASNQTQEPDLIGGCSVVYFGEPTQVFSGIVHVGESGNVAGWYGKMHLVMFGEYIPLIQYLPFISAWVPPGMGVEQGDGPVSVKVGELSICPSICIETAVERVCVNQVASLVKQGDAPDVIVNVTNDGWFDRTSVVEHHLRCSQLVAVACRRPVLIAANGGPTAWIDGAGRVVDRLRNDEVGFILAKVAKDGRWGLNQTIGDWPARMLAIYCAVVMVREVRARWVMRGKRREALLP